MLDSEADRARQEATTRVNSARYMPGFGNDFETEILPGALPQGQNSPQKPVKLDNTMAFMFETRFPQQLTAYAAALETLQDGYTSCWEGLERKFDGTPGPK